MRFQIMFQNLDKEMATDISSHLGLLVLVAVGGPVSNVLGSSVLENVVDLLNSVCMRQGVTFLG